MDDVSREPQLEKLTSELAWLKRLASALVRDEHDARDLVQETWLVAAEHAPTDGRPLKPWLSRVALNVVRMRSRAAKRRLARETAVESFAEPAPSPDELVSRVEAQRLVVDEVLRLAEPYRNTILLHYFQELSSAEISRRFGIPEGTVRRRLKAALDELRDRLHAEERKTGRAVVGALAPLAVQHSAASAGRAALGVVLVKKAIALVVVVVGLLLVGSRLYSRRGHVEGPVSVGGPIGSGGAAHASQHDAVAAHIAVMVTDQAGPIANAIVRCAPADGEVVIAKTANDGRASLDLTAGPWSIAASAEGHEPAASTLDVVAGRDDKVRLVLATGGLTLTGTVTDATGGAIAGARIDAAQLHLNTKPGRAVSVAFSDGAGRYKLAVGGGAILVEASHPDYASQARYVDLGASGATADFALVPGGVIEGVVRDSQTKQPVAGAAVRAETDGSGQELAGGNERLVKADAAGKFRFSGLRPGAYQLFAREGTRRSLAPVDVGLGVAEQQTDIVVLIGATATLRGKVVDESGAPASKVTVRASGGGEGDTAISDDTGAFVFEGLSPGRWALRGASERYVSDGQAIVPLKKSDVDGVVVRVRHGLEVTGHVEPREPCDVEIANVERDGGLPRHDSMTTNADGNFHFTPFGPGQATLVARCPSGDQGSVAVAVPATGETVVPVTPGGSMEGRVVDGSGKPIEGVMVTAEPAGDMTRIEFGVVASGFKAVTSAGGVFAIRGLAAASYRFGVLENGRPVKTKKTVKLALAAGQHATGVELVVERSTGTIQGTVTGPDGSPIADAWVAVHQSMDDQLEALHPSDDDSSPRRFSMQGGAFNGTAIGAEAPPVLTDARGHFAITNLLHGRYQVVAEARAGKLRGGAANVTTDAEIAIRLAGVGSLRGTVRGPRGPTDLFSVQLAGPKFDGGSFTDGAFAFPRLDPGDYTIEVTSADGTGTAKVRVSADEAASVDILLVTNGTVTGRIVDKAGKPVSGMGAALLPDQPPGKLSIALQEDPPTSGPDGRFQVEGAPGTRTLVILGHPPTARRGLSIAAGNTVDVGDVTVEEPPK